MLRECWLWTLGSAVKWRDHEMELRLESGGNSWVRGDWDVGNELSWGWWGFFSLCFYLGSVCPGLLPHFCNPSSLKTLRQRAGASAEIPRFLRSYSEDAFQRPKPVACVIQEQRFMNETTSHCKCRDDVVLRNDCCYGSNVSQLYNWTAAAWAPSHILQCHFEVWDWAS